MKLTAFVTAIVFAASAFAGPVLADEVQHYRAKPSETLEEAVNNFSEYNKLLSEVLAKDEAKLRGVGQVYLEIAQTVVK